MPQTLSRADLQHLLEAIRTSHIPPETMFGDYSVGVAYGWMRDAVMQLSDADLAVVVTQVRLAVMEWQMMAELHQWPRVLAVCEMLRAKT
jgi:hypothetical protein